MTEETITTEDKKLDEAFSAIPDEVIDFMNGKAFDIVIDAIAKTLELTDIQKLLVRNASYDVLARLKNLEDVYSELVEKGIDSELALKISTMIETEVVERAANITEFYTDDVEEESPETISSDIVKSAPTPAAVLASLGERLSKSNVVAPSVRNYTPETPKPTQPSEPARRSIDPYREMPEL